MGHCLWECHVPHQFMTLSLDLISPRDEAERKNSLPCIEAINKIIILLVLFQPFRLLAQPATVKDNFLLVTGVGE